MINIKNMSFSYVKGSELLKNINLEIPKGVYLSIIGENGSCKSTLIKLILNLLKPDSGVIELSCSRISYVPQRLDNFNADFPLTVKELLKAHVGSLKLKDSKAVDNALKEVGMLEFKNKLIGNLSGGQQQKIFIARALIGNPELIILDEPSTGIDEKSQNEIYPILKKLNTECKKTIISVEHNTKVVLKYSTHILKVENGNMTLFTKDDYINHLKKDDPLSGVI